MEIKVVELFAGVGGFRVGLEKASDKFNTIWANQWEPSRKTQYAYECYIKHFGEGSCINEDIAIAKKEVPEHNLLVGGFPCQDYSVAATGAKGIEGKKGVLWWEIRDIIEAKKPNYVLLENVDRLLKSPASQRGRDFGIILKSLNDLGYVVEWRVLNAAEYGFVQRRRRVFIFASRQNIKYSKKIMKVSKETILNREGFFADIFPAENIDSKRTGIFSLSEFKDLVDVTKNFKTQFWNSGVCIEGKGYTQEVIAKKINSKSLKTIIEKGIVDNKYFLSKEQEKKFDFLRGAKKLERIKPNGDKYLYAEGGMSPFDSLDLPARTMLTSEGSINRSTHIVKDIKTGKIRLLTPIECERINGFPDNWTGEGIMPEKFRYFCMGNALVVGLIEIMGKKIEKISN
ncbi:MAG: DNA (cytosine-5-)-methyltransferase [Erysipelotrichales bacterium]|nr:DNA (cytosine-5-)-methyltransferase [Erysipelotrichales bacterium]